MAALGTEDADVFGGGSLGGCLAGMRRGRVAGAGGAFCKGGRGGGRTLEKREERREKKEEVDPLLGRKRNGVRWREREREREIAMTLELGFYKGKLD